MINKLWHAIAALAARYPGLSAWLQRRAVPYYDIYGADGTLYMRRWWLLPRWCLRFDPVLGYPSPKRWMPFSIRLHHIVRPDADRHLHDHPFSFRTLVLQGWYEEEYLRSDTAETVSRYLWVGATAHAPAARWHRIAEVSPDGVWTVFIMSRRQQGWGFLVDGRKVPWREYLGEGGQP